ncbi:hypothetical protein HMPREF2533_03991, partial [Bacteroides fragilis]
LFYKFGFHFCMVISYLTTILLLLVGTIIIEPSSVLDHDILFMLIPPYPSFTDSSKDPRLIFKEVTSSHCRVNSLNISIMFLSVPF